MIRNFLLWLSYILYTIGIENIFDINIVVEY